ncbi:MAG: response regulator [Methylococcaceae bacterium]
MRILIVDDNIQMRNLLRITFSTHTDYELFEAKNGLEAMDLIRKFPPDIVFLDIMMPGDIDGLGVCEFIKKSEYKSCFVVLLSAKGQKMDIELGLEMGADMYLTKPFSPIALLDVVEDLKTKS